MENQVKLNFKGMVLKPSLQALIVAGLAATALAFGVSMLASETRLNEMVSLNQWLARDIASQFSGVASQALGRAQKFGALVRRESGTFDAGAQREFDADPLLKAVWILDATGSGPLQPLAKIERDGFTIAEPQVEGVRRLIEAAIRDGSAARGIIPGVNAIALKVGDMPRTVLLFSDETLFSRASGGPWGEKWMLMAPSADRTESVLVEATSELKEGVQFPSFEEISRFVTSQSPTEERSEFSSEIVAASGSQFQISGVRTGAFGVIAVAVTPLENSARAANVSLAMRLAMGIAIALSLLVMLVQTLRFRLSVSRARSTVRPETIQVEEIT
ncbi:hypothetical protein BH10BDE1_BH10BDE1_02440 [soil metagenome]